MKFYPPSGHCQNCACQIEQQVLAYSMDNFHFALCKPCQQTLKNKLPDTTEETRDLYFSLKKRNVPAVLARLNGDKTNDIAVTDAKINIEVQGRRNNINLQQFFSELPITYDSLKKGHLTLKIPHMLVREKLDETVNYICDFLFLSKQQNASQ